MSEGKIIVKSKRLYLRHLRLSDQDTLFAIYSDKEAMKFRHSAAFEKPGDATKMIEKAIDQINKKIEYRFGIIKSETNELVGTFLYKIIDETTCEIGYSIGKRYWNLGYGYETLSVMLNYLKEIGFKNIIATTKKENVASIKLLIKAGFMQSINENNTELNLFKKLLK